MINLRSERQMKYSSRKGTEFIYRKIMFNWKIYHKNKNKNKSHKGKLFFLAKFFNKSRR